MKHGAAGAHRPDRPDWLIDQDWPSYTRDEHAVWRLLFDRQSRRVAGRACDAFTAGMRALAIERDRIPEFERLSETLHRSTGWQVVAVPGLLPDEVFFGHLAARRFPAGRFIRRRDQLDYIEEPDVFHDVFGHVPMLMHPVIADFMQAYGLGGLRARQLDALAMLARVYWYTIEFGLVRQPDGLRIYGAGIASSYAECAFALDDASPNRIAFSLERVMRTLYRIDDFQECYFVIDGLEALLELARIDFAPLYEAARGLPTLEPGEVAPGDSMLSRGTGRHHAARRRPDA
ncbi:MAG: phenylalanine 4-monooxygenase [Alphaproteobacteria bacterium]|nr:phenylalanine 4-monooxygenase [Alphaproteobacteria bacterium]